MAVRGVIKRYSLIVDFVKNRNKPTKADILDMLDRHGFSDKSRTLDRDFQAIREEFGINLIYDKINKYYFIDLDEDNNLNTDHILRFWDLSISAQEMVQTLREGKDALNYISLDSSENLSGIHFLPQLLKAIKANRLVSFDHLNFQTNKTSNHTIRPYLLKEYQNRWFLFGENVKYNDLRIYGIERFANLVLTDQLFIPRNNFQPAREFDNIIGINLSPFEEGQPKQDIVLSMSKEQGQYFKTLPWHDSYKIIIDIEDEFRVSLHLLPNYEFLQLLFRYCDRMTVLEPKWLRVHLKKVLSASSKKY